VRTRRFATRIEAYATRTGSLVTRIDGFVATTDGFVATTDGFVATADGVVATTHGFARQRSGLRQRKLRNAVCARGYRKNAIMFSVDLAGADTTSETEAAIAAHPPSVSRTAGAPSWPPPTEALRSMS
jgi:hypothetical protein